MYFLYEHTCHNYSFIISIESLIKNFTAVLFSYIISLRKIEDMLWQNVKTRIANEEIDRVECNSID